MNDDYTIGIAGNSANAGDWATLTNTGDNPYYGDYFTIPLTYPDKVQWDIKNNKKGDDDMRYLYEAILVNPKNDDFYIDRVVKRSETSALMAIYAESNFIQPPNAVAFDDLKTSCRVLMEWKKEKSLKKAIETIKEAVE